MLFPVLRSTSFGRIRRQRRIGLIHYPEFPQTNNLTPDDKAMAEKEPIASSGSMRWVHAPLAPNSAR